MCAQLAGVVFVIDVKGEKRARCFMPFSSLEIAKLYLKCAEILSKGLCIPVKCVVN